MNFWKKLTKPIIGLAPMDGVTDYTMREIYSEIAKPDVIFTEFVSAEGIVRESEKLLRSLKFSDKERPIVAQLFGEDPDSFKKAVKIIKDLEFDGVDINMGCPARKVMLRKAGGALIENYDLSEKIILACLGAAQNFSVSVKTRISEERWYRFLSKFDLSAVTIHGRYLKQGNTGEVNWEEINRAGKILKEKNIVVLGNGGVLNKNDGILKCKEYDLDGVLIGKAALGNPWIFSEEVFDKNDILKIIERHAKIGTYPFILKHFGWYAKGFTGAKELRTELLKTRSFEETKKVLEKYYD